MSVDIEIATGAELDKLLGLDSRPEGVTDADLRWIAKGIRESRLGWRPAFPNTSGKIAGGLSLIESHGGLTKREWIATHALQGLLANSYLIEESKGSAVENEDAFVRQALKFTDLLLAELAK